MADLGKHQRTFTAVAETRDVLLAVGFALGGLLGVAYWFGAFGRPTDFSNYPSLVMFVVCAGFGLTLLWFHVDAGLGSVRLFTGGLEVGYARRRTAVAWDDIGAVTGAVPVRHRGTPAHVGGPLRLTLRDGRRVTVPGTVQDFAALADRVHEEVLARRLPAAERTLRGGETLRFGAITLGPDGFRVAGRVLPWPAFQGFSFPWRDYGFAAQPANQLCLHADDPVTPWATVPLKDVPNAHLLVTLARTLGEAAGQAPEVMPLASPNLALPPRPPDDVLLVPAVPASRHTATWRSLATTADNSAVLLGLGGLFFLLLGLPLVMRGVQLDVNGVIHLILLLGAAGICVAGLVIGFGRVQAVEVSAIGLAWTRWGRTTERAWKEVREFYSSDVRFVQGPADPGRTGGRIAAVRLVFDDGQTVTLNLALSDYDVLVDAIRRGVTAARLPAARRELAAGGGVDFGLIRATPAGLAAEGKVLAWDKIDRAWVGNGVLGWRSRKGHTREYLLQGTPNYDVLLALIRDNIGDRCEYPGLP